METNGNRQVNSWNEEEEKMAGSSADGTPAFMWRFLCWSLRRTTGSEMDLLNEVVFSCKYGGTCGFTEAHRLEKDGALSPGCDEIPSQVEELTYLRVLFTSTFLSHRRSPPVGSDLKKDIPDTKWFSSTGGSELGSSGMPP